MGEKLRQRVEKADLAKLLAFFHVLSEAFRLACRTLGFEATKIVAGFKHVLQLLAAWGEGAGMGKEACFGPAWVNSPPLPPSHPAPSTVLLKSPERSSDEIELWMSYSVDSPPRAAFYLDALEGNDLGHAC